MNDRKTANADATSTIDQTQKWYFEKWHEYQKKGYAIQSLYFDVLKWSALKSDLGLLKGKGKIAADIGSAHGYVVDLLSKLGYFACGCELSKFFIRSYAKNNAENIIECDAQVLPFEQKRIDLITAFELIEHLPKYSQFLSECYGL